MSNPNNDEVTIQLPLEVATEVLLQLSRAKRFIAHGPAFRKCSHGATIIRQAITHCDTSAIASSVQRSGR